MSITPVVAVSVLALVAGCGVAERAAPAAATARAFSHAIADGDATGACALLAPRTAERVDPCDPAITELRLPTGEVRDTQLWGDRAHVRTSADTLFLVELADGWRIAAAGCVPAEEDGYDCQLEST
jgi:hypothetical protein